MPNQPIKKLDEEQTSNMIRKAATNALTRKTKIENAVKNILYTYVEHILSMFIILYVYSLKRSKSTIALS